MVETLGVIVVAASGTPVNAVTASIGTGTHSDPGVVVGQAVMCQRFTVQGFIVTTNVYVGNKAAINLATGDGLLRRLPALDDVATFELLAGMPGANGLIDLRQIWIDADTNDDAVLISYETAARIKQA